MDKTPKLKPCPFCNNVTPRNAMQRTGLKVKRDPVAYLEPHCWIVLCLDCGACGPNRKSEDAAIEAWNTRTDPAHDALVEAAQDALEDITGPITDSGIKIRFSTRDKLVAALQAATEPR